MDRIRQLRKERGLSQAKLAVMADMDPATLNRLEQGKGNPNLKTLERVAGALDVSIAELLEDTSPKAERRSSLEPPLNGFFEEERRADEGRILWHLASLDEITPGLIDEALYAGKFRRACFEVQEDGSVIVRGWSA